MITSIQATNFRRHAELDLRFDDNAQLILIAGPNGAGKTTVLEVLDFAFWGESRHGRRNLDNLIRRGAELEGMSVEVSFTVGNDTYRVHRRRDGKSSTAVLYCNDIPLVEGPAQVSEEIGMIMGMDAAGFRLAVTAHQKDLDGLASLRPAERAQMITRLLRLDALTSAKQAATARFRTERELAQALTGADIPTIEAELAALGVELADAQSELARARDAVAVIDAELAASADVEAAWRACEKNVARIEGSLDALRTRERELRDNLATLVIPAPVEASDDMAALTAQVADTERRIAQAESAAREARQRGVVADELARVTERAKAARARLGEVSDAVSVTEAQAALEAIRREAEQLEESRDAEKAELIRVNAAIAALSERLSATSELGSECDTCGQQISDEHRHSQSARLSAEIDELTAQKSEIIERGRALQAALKEANASVEVHRAQVEHARSDAAEAARLGDELAELARRADTYTKQIERLTGDGEDVDALYVQKARLALQVSEAIERAEQVRARETALGRQAELTMSLAAATETLAARAADLEAARPGADLQARYIARQETADKKALELELLRHWTTEIAVLGERSAATRKRLADARDNDARRSAHQQAAIHAAGAARLLGDVSEHLSTQIRPSLEGAVSGLLSTMSEGRFNAVKISDEYNISVEDDGKFRALSELSGGEVDLVALAVRLALSQVVSDRHGAGGAGFLILDECLGSQDPARRQSIVGALRALRDTYQQIFLISHVENIEDSADVVVNVAIGEDREAEVTVA